MRMRLQRAERFCRPRGWLIPAALLAAFVPKCVLCLLAYAGIAGALGFAGPEICGGPDSGEFRMVWLMASSLVLFAAVVIARRQRRRAAARDGCV